MKLMESLPIVFVVLVAAAALALDDTPEYESVPKPPERPAALVPAVALPVEKTLSPNEALVAGETLELPTEAPKPKAASAKGKAPTRHVPTRNVTVRTAKAEPPRSRLEVPRSRVDVEGRRPGPDERLRHAVMGALTRQPNLSGKIGVEARDAVVRLSGWTTTPGESLRAEKAAARVDGVRRVVNEIRPRMGPITS